MINIIVRSSKDADAVKATINKFYRDWNIGVYTLHGARKIDDINYWLEKTISDDKFYLLLLGREEKDIVDELRKNKPDNLAIYIVPRKKVRNTRIEHLAWIFDIGKSIFRLAVGWRNDLKAYVFSQYNGVRLEDYSIDPAYDIFLGIGKEFKDNLEKILGDKICKLPLLVRKYGGEHDIYCGDRKVAILHISDEGVVPKGEITRKTYDEPSEEKVLEANKQVFSLYEKISIKLLEKYREWADTVIVPWSGGKDSTATLLLALKVFSKNKVKAIYADTGTEFPWNHKYIDEIAEDLGVEVIRVYAGIDKGILDEGYPMPRHDNRWCTYRKIKAIEETIEKLSDGNILLVKGDRDGESRARSMRPPVYVEGENKIVVTPLKFWSAAHVQLYMLMNNVELNPLYYKGFYRIGCYICPALRSWEVYIMMNDPELRSVLEKYPLYKLFIRMRKNRISS
ncbi:phosphoadenosine phosphosulfate reductase family protein [Staphylothermus hellenicus]|uniref:Phosphoadenosine phosphosulfate reductase n=1 Tax=Staphylothermus hellenicus (strain DSM 12710 / JCM 10830 / BK20S6-10-b1 / P8) TaxID=591019 RepID=D7DBI9_STAHD|nr:phosphoadenosine phosphosulfate reductase family protein [Staphylothermus hellenicus]ADI31536.1 phosphoadenosine phosphosulfate reductase [Staphylothermus hellenicus DSM 12710]